MQGINRRARRWARALLLVFIALASAWLVTAARTDLDPPVASVGEPRGSSAKEGKLPAEPGAGEMAQRAPVSHEAIDQRNASAQVIPSANGGSENRKISLDQALITPSGRLDQQLASRILTSQGAELADLLGSQMRADSGLEALAEAYDDGTKLLLEQQESGARLASVTCGERLCLLRFEAEAGGALPSLSREAWERAGLSHFGGHSISFARPDGPSSQYYLLLHSRPGRP